MLEKGAISSNLVWAIRAVFKKWCNRVTNVEDTPRYLHGSS
jgi:hypothetical protein